MDDHAASWRYPFGAEMKPSRPHITGSRPVYVLGAYPSALHVAWRPPAGTGLQRIRALAVADEPEPFWAGDHEPKLVNAWISRHFRAELGSVKPAALYNGSSGRWLIDQVFVPLGLAPRQVWKSDCLDTYRQSSAQQRRLADTYAPVAAENGLSAAHLPPHPKENAIVREALAEHTERLRAELAAARPVLVITLGSAAARVFHALAGAAGSARKALSIDDYGRRRGVEVDGHPMVWLALAHPAAPVRWQKRHQQWVDERRAALEPEPPIEPLPWRPQIASPDSDHELVVWIAPTGPRAQLHISDGTPAAQVVERLAEFLTTELAGDGRYADLVRSRRARDVVLTVAFHNGSYAIGSGPLNAPDDHPRVRVSDLMRSALELVRGQA